PRILIRASGCQQPFYELEVLRVVLRGLSGLPDRISLAMDPFASVKTTDVTQGNQFPGARLAFFGPSVEGSYSWRDWSWVYFFANHFHFPHHVGRSGPMGDRHVSMVLVDQNCGCFGYSVLWTPNQIVIDTPDFSHER